MLAAALDEEVNAFLGRDRYERSDQFCGYRNGRHRSRELTVDVSAVEVRVPRVSDVPEEVSPDGSSSRIVRRYERSSRQTQELFRKLYMEGLSTGDFEPVFRELVGETTALSANAIVRLKSRWEEEYRSWRSSRLDECRYAYMWAYGVCLGAGGDREKTALLCVVGVREDCDKELVGNRVGLQGEHGELGVRAARSEGSGDECAAACCRGRCARSVVGIERGLPDDRSSALLEPSLAERGGEAAEIDALVVETQAEGDLPCADARRV